MFKTMEVFHIVFYRNILIKQLYFIKITRYGDYANIDKNKITAATKYGGVITLFSTKKCKCFIINKNSKP